MRCVIYCFFALIFCLVATCGCQKAPPDRREILQAPFCAEIKGEMREVAFSAKIESGGGDGEIKITYLTPAPLSELCLRTRLCANGTLGEDVEISQGTTKAELPFTAAEGLLLPISLLLSHAQEDAATVQKTTEGYQFTFADGTAIALTAEGIPQAVSSTELSFQIVWWEG